MGNSIKPDQPFGTSKFDSRTASPEAESLRRNPKLSCSAVSEDLREQYAPQTPTTEHAAADQEAHETAVLLIALFTFVTFVLLLFLVPPFAQQMREEKPA